MDGSFLRHRRRRRQFARLPTGHTLTFAVGNALTRCALFPIWVQERRARGFGPLRPALYGPVAGTLRIASAFLPRPWVWLAWGVLTAAEIGLATARHRDGQPVVFDTAHMLERIGSFVMISFGETVALLTGAVMGTHGVLPWLTAGLGFVFVAALFWLFYDVTLERVEHAVESLPEAMGQFLGFAQVLVVAGLIGVASGIAAAVTHAHDPALSPAILRVFAGGTAMLMLGVNSLSMGAMRVMFTVRGVRLSDVPPAKMRALRKLIVITLAQALAMPIVVVCVGGWLPPWLVVALLEAPIVTMITGGARRRRR